MNFVNLTPHELNVHIGSRVESHAPSGEVARVEVFETPAGEVGGIPVVLVEYGEVEGLPSPKEGVAYIVSGMVESAVRLATPERRDVYSPGALVRNEAGQPQGCKGLKQSK